MRQRCLDTASAPERSRKQAGVSSRVLCVSVRYVRAVRAVYLLHLQPGLDKNGRVDQRPHAHEERKGPDVELGLVCSHLTAGE